MAGQRVVNGESASQEALAIGIRLRQKATGDLFMLCAGVRRDSSTALLLRLRSPCIRMRIALQDLAQDFESAV